MTIISMFCIAIMLSCPAQDLHKEHFLWHSLCRRIKVFRSGLQICNHIYVPNKEEKHSPPTARRSSQCRIAKAPGAHCVPHRRKVGYNKRQAGPSVALTHEQHGQCFPTTWVCLGKLATSKSCFFLELGRHCLTLKQEKWWLLGTYAGWLFMLEVCSAVTQCIHQKETADKWGEDIKCEEWGWTSSV